MRPARTILVLLLTCGLSLSACAINPATGKRQFVLISEAQEIEMGREADRSVTSRMGLYDDPALQEYVRTLGLRLAALSERPRLEWSFKVVDDPVVNAFALPGGYIYITRGILAHLDNEAELAAILGHEIGHITARHSVSQMSKAQAAQIGLGAVSVATPEYAQRYGGLLETGAGLVFLKFGRDDERQSDDLGLRYMTAAGYDSREMADVFDMLERVGNAAGGGRLPAWASTHPAPENRRERSLSKLAEMGQSFEGRPVRREEYLRRIDGIVFGEDPRQGYFEGTLFYHPEMRFRFQFPRAWRLENQRQVVLGINEEKNALVQLTLAGDETARAALDKFFSQEGVTRTGPAMGSVGGLDTSGDGFSVTSEQLSIQGRVGFVEYRGQVFQLLGYAVQSEWANHQSAIRGALASFRELTDPRALNVEPRRLEIAEASRRMSLTEFANSKRSTATLDELALLNRLSPDDRLQPGQPTKLIVGGRQP